MPDENIRTTMQFQADITDFKSAMQEANRAVKLANSEFKAASSGMDDWGNSTDGLAAKLNQLAAVHDAEKRKLDVLAAAYEKAVAEQGAASAAAVDLQTKINNQQAVVNKTQKEFDSYAAKLKEVESGADGAASDIKSAGDAAKEAGDDAKDGADGWSIMKDVISDFVSNAISSAVDALTSLAEATREYRRDMAQMAQNASDAGQDMGKMKDVLADVAAVTGETDAAMEGLNMLMATGLDTTNLTNAAEAFAGAATKFDGLKFEGLAEGLQETLAVGQAVGPFAELIERTGGNLEEFNEGMAACTTQAEKQQYAMKFLNESGLKEVHESYKKNNADLVEAEKAQFRYNDSLAKVGAAIEPVNTALANVGATILEKVAPIVEDIVGWVLDNLPTIEPIITGIAVALGVLAAALAIQGLISGVTKAFALLNTTMLANPIVLIVAALAGLVAAFVALWNKSEAFRNFWIDLWEGIKEKVAAVAQWFSETASKIAGWFSDSWKNIKDAWSGVKDWFGDVREGINKKFEDVGNWFSKKFTQAKDLAQKAWSGVKGYFGKVKDGVTGTWSKFDTWMGNKFGDAWTNTKKKFSLSSVSEYFSNIKSKVSAPFEKIGGWFSDKFSAAYKNITAAFRNAGVDFGDVWAGIKKVFKPSEFLSIGGDMISGLWSGIKDKAQWLKEKLTGWIGDVVGWFKDKLGIHSPSTVMRDEVGKMLGLGMAEGITDSRNAVNSAVRKLGDAALGGLSPAAGGAPGAVAGGRVINYTQNNYSPRALSRREIYRQTHNALAFAGGA